MNKVEIYGSFIFWSSSMMNLLRTTEIDKGHVNTVYSGLVEDWLRIGWGCNEVQVFQSSTNSHYSFYDATLYLKRKSVMS